MARDLSRETAERLLSGVSASPRDSGDPLTALLAAAAAPARQHELAGEREALTAFRALPPPKPRFPLRRALAVKVAALVTATVAAGGIAMASTTGILPNPFKPTEITPTSQEPQPTSVGSVGTSPSITVPSSKPPELPTTALPGLCRALMAKAQGDRGKALGSPAFADLVEAAGRPQDVEAFCARLLATPEPKPTGQPAKSHKPPQSHRAPTR